MNILKAIIIPIFLFASCFVPSHCYTQSWKELDSIRLSYQSKQSFDTALIFAEQALERVRLQLGEKDTMYAEMHAVMTFLCYYTGDLKRAADYAEKEVDLRKIIQGKDHPAYAGCLSNLGFMYMQLARFSEAEIIFKEAIELQKKTLGELHPSYAQSLNNLAGLYDLSGNYPKALIFYNKSLQINIPVLGKQHLHCISTKNNLAGIHDFLGDYSKAREIYNEVVELRKAVQGETHLDYAVALSNLAGTTARLGDYPNAESLYLQAINIAKETLGENHETYARFINNLASMYDRMGNYTKSEKLYLKALEIKKNTIGKEHPGYANSLQNLASLYEHIGKNNKAESLFLEAKDLYKKTLGEKHQKYAHTLNNLAVLYVKQDRFQEAEILYYQAMQIYEEALGKNNLRCAATLNNLGELYNNTRSYKKADSLFQSALDIVNNLVGKKHQNYATSLINLAYLSDQMGQNSDMQNSELLFKKSAKLFIEALDIITYNINRDFAILSEKEKEQYFVNQQSRFNAFNSFVLRRKHISPELKSYVYNNAIRNKGLLLKSSTAMRSAVLASGDSVLTSLYSSWIALKREISQLNGLPTNKRYNDLNQLNIQADAMEKELVRSSHTFSDFDRLQSLTWIIIRDALKADEAAIEFVRFNSGYESDSVIYCALLITAKSKYPEMIPLFLEKDLIELTRSKNKNNIEYIAKVYGTKQKKSDTLYRLIWKPLEEYLSEIKTIYYSPDGLLHKISLDAIGTGKNILLCDTYNLNRLGSTGNIVLSGPMQNEKEYKVGLFGGIDYNTDKTKVKVWRYLPGTKIETDGIAERFRRNNIDVEYFAGKDASEEEFKKVAGSCDLLHISSHGFFFPDPTEYNNTKKDTTNAVRSDSSTFTRKLENSIGHWNFYRNKDPLMRSGLVFATANKVWNEEAVTEGEDGVLTANEVSQLDLHNTELVVLSACETGLGDIKGSEGVYGLQRALKMAGVRYIIMSLWQVADKETEEFMTSFYINLLKSSSKDIRKAFASTQKELRLKYDPYFWGGFVLAE